MYENLQNVIIYIMEFTRDQFNPCCYNRVDNDTF